MISFPLYPMLLQKSGTVPTGSNYIHQLKIDGIRAMMHYTPSGIKISSRHLTDMSLAYPELTSLRLNATDAILDGEICVLDDKSKPSFEKTFQRFQASGFKVKQYVQSMPVTYFAFDILQLNRQPLINKKLTERLEILREVVQPSDHLVMLESYEDGVALFEATKNMGLEGTVSKDKNSTYLLNKRSSLWLKNKHYEYDTVEVIGIRKGDFAWALSQHGKYVGTTELVPADARKALRHVAKQIIKKEDKHWIWLEPLVKIEVKSIGRTSKNLLRTPSFSKFVLQKPVG